MYCNHCGAKLADGSNFCSECGMKVSTITSDVKSAGENTDIRSPNKNNIFKKLTFLKKTKKISHNDIKAQSNSHDTEAKANNKTKHLPLYIVIGAGALIVLFLIVGFIIMQGKYNEAQEILEDKNYSKANSAFYDIRWYRDSLEKAMLSNYELAKSYMSSGRYQAALNIFLELDEFEDSENYAQKCENYITYNEAVSLLNNGEFLKAKSMFEGLRGFQDSIEYAQLCQKEYDYAYSVALIDRGEYQLALDSLIALGKHNDSVELALYCQNMLSYFEAVELMDSGDYAAALDIFYDIEEIEDSEERALVCGNHVTYSMAEDAIANGNNFDAYMLFGSVGDFLDAAQRRDECILETPEAVILSRNSDYSSTSCSITIVAPADDYNLHTYMKIYSETGDLVLTLFIPSGEKLKIGLPSGTYTFKAGYGLDWFGEQDAFGPMADYSVLLFDGGKDTWTISSRYVYTLTLLSSTSGNVGGSDENFDDF